jgi:hypothetical protein
MDDILKEELGTIYINIPGFYVASFGNMADLETTSNVVSRNAEKAAIYSTIRKIGGTDTPKTKSRKTS